MNAAAITGWLGPLCALASSFTWAIGSAGYSRLSRTHSAFAVNFSRALVALPLYLIAAFVAGGGWEGGLADFRALGAKSLGWFALSMVASYGLGDVVFLWSTRSLGLPGALSVSSCYPIWTALAGMVFNGERLGLMQLAGMLVTIAGIAVVILNGPVGSTSGGALASSVRTRGVLLALLTSVMWAVNGYSIAQGGRGLSAAVCNSSRMLMAMALSAGFSRLILPGREFRLPWREIRANFWIFALEAFAGSYFFMYGMSHSPLAVAATLSSLAPAVSVPVALVLGLEKFSLARTAGVIAVVGGIALLLGA